MTTSAQEKTRFFAYLPDYPNSVTHRFAVRERHLVGFKERVTAGIISCAGVLVNPEEPKIEIGGETKNNATGSMLIIEAETIEEARKIIESDVYWKEGVWDKEKMVIQRFAAATPFPITTS